MMSRTLCQLQIEWTEKAERLERAKDDRFPKAQDCVLSKYF